MDKYDPEFFAEQIMPGGFITKFDAAFFNKVNEYLTSSITLGEYLENMKNKKLIRNDITNVIILQKCFVSLGEQSQSFNDKFLSDISLAQFLSEGFCKNGRLFSAMEKGDRKVLTKPLEGKSWNPGENQPIIDDDYLKELNENKEASYYKKKDYDTELSVEEINERIVVNAKRVSNINDLDRKKYGFTFDSKDKESIPNTSKDIEKINMVRRFGVLIFDLLMAEIGLQVFDTYSDIDKQKLIYLFRNHITKRSEVMANHVTEFLDQSNININIKICLLQEVGTQLMGQFNDPQQSKREHSNLTKSQSSLIMSKDNTKLIEDEDEGKEYMKSGEAEHHVLNIDSKEIHLYSFHGDTKGTKTIPFIESVFEQHTDTNVIIGLDSNLKSEELLKKFFESVSLKGGKVAGFDLTKILATGFNFTGFYNNLNKYATNGGIRSACQSQLGKIHDSQQNYIDFIVYKGDNIKQVSELDSTSFDSKLIDSANKLADNNALVNLKNAGVIDGKVYEWGSKVLSKINPSDHLPRCSTFSIYNKKIQVMSWNMAGPNFNWAEYYGDTTIEEINNAIDIIINPERHRINTAQGNENTRKSFKDKIEMFSGKSGGKKSKRRRRVSKNKKQKYKHKRHRSSKKKRRRTKKK